MIKNEINDDVNEKNRSWVISFQRILDIGLRYQFYLCFRRLRMFHWKIQHKNGVGYGGINVVFLQSWEIIRSSVWCLALSL